MVPGGDRRRVAGVVLASDGRPAAGARVEARGEYFDLMRLPVPSGTADSAGRFDLGPQPSIEIVVVARPANGVGWADQKLDLRKVAPWPDPEAVELRLQDCEAVVRGVVVDVEGHAVPSAEVAVLRWDRLNPNPLGLEHVDASGRFRTCRPSRDRLTVRAKGFAETNVPPGEPPAGHRIVLVAESTISGEVQGPDGTPVPGAKVWMWRQSDGPAIEQLGTAVAMSDAEGRFELVGLLPGRHVLGAAASGLRSLWSAMPLTPAEADAKQIAIVTVAASERLDGVVVHLGACRRLTGVVLDHDGDPVSGASVFHQTTAADGSFALECIGPGTIDVEVNSFKIEDLIVPAGHSDVEDFVVELPAGPVVVVQVVRGRAAVAGAMVNGQATDTNGHARLHARARDRVQVVVEHEKVLCKQDISVGEDGDVLLPIDLDTCAPGAGRVRGRVISRDGQPVTTTEICLRGKSSLRTFVDFEGAFVLAEVPPGRYTIQPGCGDNNEIFATTDASAPFDVASGQTVEREIRIAAQLTTLAGEVTRPDGGTRVAQVCLDGWSHACQITGSDGRFSFDGIADGPRRISVVALDGLYAHRYGLAPSKDIVIPVVAPGTVQVTAADPPGECTANLMGIEPHHSQSLDGRFVFEKVEAGEYRLQVSCAHGAVIGAVDATVHPGKSTMVSVRLTPRGP
jgi:hypothetical protein